MRYVRSKRQDTFIKVGISKLIFSALVLAYGRQFLGQQAGIAIIIDLVAVALFVGYFLGVRRKQIDV